MPRGNCELQLNLQRRNKKSSLNGAFLFESVVLFAALDFGVRGQKKPPPWSAGVLNRDARKSKASSNYWLRRKYLTAATERIAPNTPLPTLGAGAPPSGVQARARSTVIEAAAMPTIAARFLATNARRDLDVASLVAEILRFAATEIASLLIFTTSARPPLAQGPARDPPREVECLHSRGQQLDYEKLKTLWAVKIEARLCARNLRIKLRRNEALLPLGSGEGLRALGQRMRRQKALARN